MTNDVFDYDWQSMYPLQLGLYDAFKPFLKGENEIGIKESPEQDLWQVCCN